MLNEFMLQTSRWLTGQVTAVAFRWVRNSGSGVFR